MISFASFGTKLTFLIQLGHAQRMLSNTFPLEMNFASMNCSSALSLDTAVNELVRKETHLATLQAQNKLNVLTITPSASSIEQPQQSGDSSRSNNHCKQTNKKFCNYCKHPSHTIETCYRCNKSTVVVANIEPTSSMASISAESQSSRSTINLSSTKLQEIIAQIFVWLVMHLFPLLSQFYLVSLKLGFLILPIAIT